MNKQRQAYKEGYEAGKREGDIDFMIKFCKILQETKGIGDRLLFRAMESAKEMERNEH